MKRKPTHPGNIVKEDYLKPLSLTITEMATTLGVSRKTLSKILNERGTITPDIAPFKYLGEQLTNQWSQPLSHVCFNYLRDFCLFYFYLLSYLPNGVAHLSVINNRIIYFPIDNMTLCRYNVVGR